MGFISPALLVQKEVKIRSASPKAAVQAPSLSVEMEALLKGVSFHLSFPPTL